MTYNLPMADPALTDHQLVTLEQQPTIAVRIMVPMSEMDVSALFATYLPQLFESIAQSGQSPTGAPFARYFEFGPEQADVEVGIPVDTPTLDLPPTEDRLGEIGASQLPGGLTAKVAHLGSYDTLGDAYDPFHEWIHQQGHDEGTGPWESYVDDPDQVADDTQLRTEIYWPVAN